MKRSNITRQSSLAANSQLQSRTRINPRSERTQRLYEEVRVPLVKRLLAERPLCERCGKRKSVDIHEVHSRGRTGGVNSTEWLDEDNLRALCRICHNLITEHKLPAEEMAKWLK